MFAIAVELFKFFYLDELAINTQPLIAFALSPVCQWLVVSFTVSYQRGTEVDKGLLPASDFEFCCGSALAGCLQPPVQCLK